jgi:hypothetical protein
MALERTDPALVNHIMAEHRELFRRLCDLRTRLSTTTPATAAAVTAAVADLEDLRHHLAGHFTREEAGGFLEESVARLPRLAGAATAVLGQHHGLLARLDALIARLSRDGARAWPDAARSFEDFTHAMQAHEREENAVFQAGYVEDLGLDE